MRHNGIMPKDPKKKDTSWGGVAEWYSDYLEKGEDTYQNKVILPNLLRTMEIKEGDRVLDIACGQGFFTREYKKAGALVMGADISPELINLAKKHNPEIDFHVAASDALIFAPPSSFNKAVIVLALQNIKKIKETCIEVSRVLLPGGKLYIVLNHPAFRIPHRSSWEWDEKNNKQFRKIDAYLSEATVNILMHPGKNKQSTVSFHRPLQVYFKHMRAAGFAVTRLEEWISHKESEAGPRSKEENRMRKEIPLFLFLEATLLT